MVRYKYNISFELHRRPRADGSFFVRMVVVWLKKRAQRNLPIHVFPDQWDAKAMCAKPTRTHRDVGGINNVIYDFRNRMSNLFEDALRKDHVPTMEEVSAAMRYTEEEAAKLHRLDTTIEEFVKNQSRERGWVPATAEKFKSLLHDLTCAGLKNVEEMNGVGMEKFLDYLSGRNLENAVYMKKCSVLRWFLGWCRKVGYLDNDEYKLHQPHLKCPKKEVVYLTWDELMRLNDFDFGNRYTLANVRDVFCLCAFTGMRFSDAAKLQWSDIRGDHITIVTQKTNDKLEIELNPYSKSVLERNYVKGYSSPSRKVLSAISIQKSNVLLKECAMFAKIDEPIRLISYKGGDRIEKVTPKWKVITTHCARRTFVVNALRFGIPAEVIMKWTGHSDFSAMKPYVDIVDDVKKENMAKFGATELIKNDIQRTVFQHSIK